MEAIPDVYQMKKLNLFESQILKTHVIYFNESRENIT